MSSPALYAALNEPINQIFIYLTGGVFAFAVAAHPFRWLPAFTAAVPALLTSIGVLGTFVGIFIGLLDFNVSAIEKSVPLLLEGMKTAFLTSVIGMGTAIAFKAYQTIIPMRDLPAANSDDPLRVLQAGFAEMKEGMDVANSNLRTLKDSISGDANSSLSTLLLKVKNAIEDVDTHAQKQAVTTLNSIMNDGFKVQIAAFEDFAKTIAENNSKALIEALNDVMRDFNAKINEQFGDNFKQLNEAVGRLLTWQEAYRQQLDQLREQMTVSQVAISESKTALESISTHASTLPPAAEALSKMLTTAQAQIDDLNARLSAFAALKDKAESAMPTLSKMLDDFTKSMTEKTGTLLSAIETENKSLRAQSETLRAEWTRTLESQKAVADAMVAEQQRLNKDTQERFANMSEELTKRLGASIETSGKNLDALVKALDDQMQEELKRAIGLMGKHLASITEKIVQDHVALAEHLRKSADIVRNVRP